MILEWDQVQPDSGRILNKRKLALRKKSGLLEK